MSFQHQTMPNMNMYTAKLQVLSVLFAEEAPIGNMVMLPHMSCLDTSILKNVEYAVDRSGGVLSASGLAPVAGQALRPNMGLGVVAPIANGWSTRRFRATIHVRVISAMGLNMEYLLTGYSEYADASMSGLVDPDMMIHINSYHATPCSQVPNPLPLSVNDLKVGREVLVTTQNHMGLFMQRPQDALYAGPGSFLSNLSGGMFNNTISQSSLSSAAQLAGMSQSAGVRWLYDFLKGVTQQTIGNEDERIAEIGARMSIEGIGTDTFFTTMARVTGNPALQAQALVSVNDLSQLDPNTPNVVRLVPYTPDVKMGALVTGDTRPLAQIATMYAQGVLGYMATYGLQVVSFVQFHNSSDPTEANGPVTITNYNSYLGARDMRQVVNAFRHAIQFELYPSASFAGTYPFNVQVQAESYGYVHINISDMMGNQEQYSFPAFASQTFSPLVTNNMADFTKLATDMKIISDAVAAIETPQPAYNPYA
jgi:hypothetical protein